MGCCREVYNVIQADEIGADIITCPADVVKVNNNLGRDIGELSVDTVKGFAKDIQSSGLSIYNKTAIKWIYFTRLLFYFSYIRRFERIV